MQLQLTASPFRRRSRPGPCATADSSRVGAAALDVRRFPHGFLWGAATAAHQVEGGNANSDWWQSETDGRVPHASGTACDSWNRWSEDVRLLCDLGLNAYRLSVEWARIEPEPGRFNQVALDHYRRQIEALHAAGIQPVVTLHHFTNPRWLADRGGWTVPDTAERFATYTARVARSLGDLVDWWLTINEPNACAARGYLRGDWPPHHAGDVRGYLRHVRNAVRGHVAARQALLAQRPTTRAGVAFACWPLAPERPWHPIDRAATPFYEWLWHGRLLAQLMDTVDWLGVNYYSRIRVRWYPTSRDIAAQLAAGGGERSDSGWEIFPEGMYRVLRSVGKFGRPIMVTENGIADADDARRTAFIRSHLLQVHRAIQDGVDVRGYLHWSLLDNFEWAEGYAHRFGLAHVDFATGRRTLRPSAHVYGRIARANAILSTLPTARRSGS